MAKYIDASKLIHDLEERILAYSEGYAEGDAYRKDAIETLLKDVKYQLSLQQEQTDMGEVSDGYHTFNELYYYRMLYNAAFFNLLPKEWVHKSKRHHTGEECFGGGWFIVMAELPTGQISNHYELKYWDLFEIPEKEVANKWDGHSPQEAAERLYKYLQQEQTEKPTKKNCNNCPHCVDRKDQYGWHFKGCFGGQYKGKFIAEIDECPLKQEQQDVDLEKESERFLESEESTSYTNAGGYVVAFKDTVKIARHFYELGRKQILKEIYDGKTKPVDKITAAWLDD